MALTTREALTIAKKYGLNLPDAKALMGLADSVEEGEIVAAEFSTIPQQLTKSDLADLSAEQIVQAKAEGRLRDLLGQS